MSSHARNAKEHLARAKAYFRRHDTLRSMMSTAAALKILAQGKVTGADRTTADGALRQLVADYNKTEEVTKAGKGPLTFTKGNDKALFLSLARIIQAHQEESNSESYEQTLERKGKIDKLLNYGKKLLAVGKVKDGSELFEEAAELYVDEHSLFRLMGAALLDANQPRIATRYLKKAMKQEKDPRPAAELLVKAHTANGNIPAAKKLEAELKNAS